MDINLCPKCKKIIVLLKSHDLCRCNPMPDGMFAMGRSCDDCTVVYPGKCLCCQNCKRSPKLRDNWMPEPGEGES